MGLPAPVTVRVTLTAAAELPEVVGVRVMVPL